MSAVEEIVDVEAIRFPAVTIEHGEPYMDGEYDETWQFPVRICGEKAGYLLRYTKGYRRGARVRFHANRRDAADHGYVYRKFSGKVFIRANQWSVQQFGFRDGRYERWRSAGQATNCNF